MAVASWRSMYETNVGGTGNGGGWHSVDGALRWALINASSSGLRGHDPSRVRMGAEGRATIVERLNTRSKIIAAVGALPKEEQVAVVMRAQDYSFREIGEQIGVSGKVASRKVTTARAKLRDRLAALGLLAD